MSFGRKENQDIEKLNATVHPLSASAAGAPLKAGDAFLGQGSKVKGAVSFDGPAEIQGAIDGEISSKDLLTIGQSAHIKASIRGAEVVVYGNVQGDIMASKRLTLRKPARIVGNISSPLMSIEEGVVFEGSCSMGSAEAKTLAVKAG